MQSKLPSTHECVLRFLTSPRAEVDVENDIWRVSGLERRNITIPQHMKSYVVAEWFVLVGYSHHVTSNGNMRLPIYKLTKIGKKLLPAYLIMAAI